MSQVTYLTGLGVHDVDASIRAKRASRVSAGGIGASIGDRLRACAGEGDLSLSLLLLWYGDGHEAS